MIKESELEFKHNSSESKNLANVTLLGICFTIFTFIISIRPELLIRDYVLTLQLVCSIPLFMSTIFARIKAGHLKKAKYVGAYGSTTFLLGYTFLVNVVGLLTSNFISLKISMIFFIVNILAALSYTIVQIGDHKNTWKRRIIKDGAFIILIILLGILPALGYISFS